MRAVVYERGRLVLAERAVPAIRPGEALVRIRSASVNALDIRMMKMGIVPRLRVYGADISGTVEAVGPGVSGWAAGDEVVSELSSSGLGGFAELAAAPARLLVRKPPELSFVQAAALPVAALSAYKGLFDIGRLKEGRRVLVCGAGGGVGTYAVQLAADAKARVLALCGSRSLELVRSLGADDAFDYAKTSIDGLSGAFDLILSVNGAYPLSAFRRKLKPDGLVVVIGGPLRHVLKVMLLGPALSIGSRKYRVLSFTTSREDLEKVVALAAQGRIRPVIESVFSLERTAEAVARAAQGHTAGKIVIRMGD